MPPLHINNTALNDHATGIGYLCFMYNGLEANVNNLLGIPATLNDTDLECFTNQIDLKKKLPILKPGPTFPDHALGKPDESCRPFANRIGRQQGCVGRKSPQDRRR
jgi:hypothetical protein